MSSIPQGPEELHDILEEYSLKLDDFKSKFNPFFSQVSHELKEKVDLLSSRIENYANYNRDHQLKHLIESQRAKEEIKAVYIEVQELRLKMSELDRIYKLGKHLS